MRLAIETVRAWCKSYGYTDKDAEYIFEVYKDREPRAYWFGFLQRRLSEIDKKLIKSKMKTKQYRVELIRSRRATEREAAACRRGTVIEYPESEAHIGIYDNLLEAEGIYNDVQIGLEVEKELYEELIHEDGMSELNLLKSTY